MIDDTKKIFALGESLVLTCVNVTDDYALLLIENEAVDTGLSEKQALGWFEVCPWCGRGGGGGGQGQGRQAELSNKLLRDYH